MTSTIPNYRIKLYKFLMQVRPTILVDIIKKIFRIQRLVIETKYGRFWADPISRMGQAILDGNYEESDCQLIASHLAAGQTFVDVGANEGFYSITAARLVGGSGRVIAIEPQGRLIPVIAKNAALNHLDNISIVQAAVNDGSTKTIRLWLSPSTMTGSSSIMARYKMARPQIVPCKTLTEIFDERQIQTADFVKIDVEGFEGSVIDGALPLLQQHRIRYLYVDYHETILREFNLDPRVIHQKIQSYGYVPASVGDPAGYMLYRVR